MVVVDTRCAQSAGLPVDTGQRVPLLTLCCQSAGHPAAIACGLIDSALSSCHGNRVVVDVVQSWIAAAGTRSAASKQPRGLD